MRIVGLLSGSGRTTRLEIAGVSRRTVINNWLGASVADPRSESRSLLCQYRFDHDYPAFDFDPSTAAVLDLEPGPYDRRLVEIGFAADEVMSSAVSELIGTPVPGSGTPVDLVIVSGARAQISSRIQGFFTPTLLNLPDRGHGPEIYGVQTCPLHGQPPVCKGCLQLVN